MTAVAMNVANVSSPSLIFVALFIFHILSLLTFVIFPSLTAFLFLPLIELKDMPPIDFFLNIYLISIFVVDFIINY